MGADLEPWDPLAPADVAALFAAFGRPWWIAGGYAVELAVGRTVRAAHGDIDVGVTRDDHRRLHVVLPGWELWAADPPGTLRRWWPDEELRAGVHDIWCRQAADGPWRLQVMIDETEGDHWVSRRDPTLRRPLRSVVAHSSDGIPYLVPSVQLSYKAKGLRPRDEIDFRAALPVLDDGERAWLRSAIASVHPGHPWLARLR